MSGRKEGTGGEKLREFFEGEQKGWVRALEGGEEKKRDAAEALKHQQKLTLPG